MQVTKKHKFVLFWLVAIFLLTRACLALSENYKIEDLHFYKDFAIFTLQSFNKEGLVNQKVVIQTIQNYNPYKQIFSDEKNDLPQFGPTFWEITINQLPVTKQQCWQVDSALCSELSDFSTRNTCYPPCIMYGPKFLAYDEQAKKLYITAYSNMIGNAGSDLFSFIVDLNYKEVKFFQIIEGPVKGFISPNGKYLALLSSALFNIQPLTLYNTNNGNKKIIFDKKGCRIKSVNWISSDKLQIEFFESERTDSKKFTEHTQILEAKI